MKSLSHQHSFEINQPIDVLFPLFSPEGEKYWVPGWDYENIMGSTELHEDYIFLTKSHSHATAEAIWLVKRYEPETYQVQFYKVEPGEKVGVVSVCCQVISANKTRVQVGYDYYSLGPKGDEFIAGFTAEAYLAFIDEWKLNLLNYFKSRRDN